MLEPALMGSDSSTNGYYFSFPAVSIQTEIYKLPCHDLSPFSNAALERPELTIKITSGVLTPETNKQRLCCGISIRL
jgi:hypothetical protein